MIENQTVHKYLSHTLIRNQYHQKWWLCLLSSTVSHLTDVLPVVIQLEQQEHGAADDQQR